jgi:hypothetical protein
MIPEKGKIALTIYIILLLMAENGTINSINAMIFIKFNNVSVFLNLIVNPSKKTPSEILVRTVITSTNNNSTIFHLVLWKNNCTITNIKIEFADENIALIILLITPTLNIVYFDVYTCSNTPISISDLILELGPLIKVIIIGNKKTEKICCGSPILFIPIIINTDTTVKEIKLLIVSSGYAFNRVIPRLNSALNKLIFLFI